MKGKWSNLGKGVAPSSIPWCSSYWKGSLLVAFNFGQPTFFTFVLETRKNIQSEYVAIKKKKQLKFKGESKYKSNGDWQCFILKMNNKIKYAIKTTNG